MISKSFASVAACLLPLVSLSAQQVVPAAFDSVPGDAPVAVADSDREISVSTNWYLVKGEGSATRFVSKMDDVTYFAHNIMMMMMLSGMDTYDFTVPGEPKVSGELYGITLSYGFEKKKLGSFTFEMDYRGGTVDDSHETLYSGSSDVQLTTGPSHISVNGSLLRAYSMDTHKVAFLALWHPKGRIGDYLGIGLSISNESVSGFYTMKIVDVSKTDDEPEVTQRSTTRFGADYDANNFLLHARLGGKPLPKLTFMDGKCGFVPRADLAIGYSHRNLKDIQNVSIAEGEPNLVNTFAAEGMMKNSGVFEGTARLSFFYALSRGQIILDAGYMYETEFGRSNSGDNQGLCGSVGYKYNW